jgi:hypothetical protein
VSNKLTFESWKQLGYNASVSDQWNAVELHTAECVAEAVAEATRNRYEIGEAVEIFNGVCWLSSVISAVDPDDHELRGYDNCDIRRPPVTRQRTDEELEHEVFGEMEQYPMARLSRSTLEAMAADLGISLTVEG